MGFIDDVEIYYGAKMPVKKKAYLLLVGGDAMTNGLHTANVNLTAADYALYATGSALDPGVDPAVIATFDINKGYRFDGTWMTAKQINQYEFKFLRPNKWKSKSGAFAVGDTLVDPQIPFLVDGTDNGYFSDGTLFAHSFCNLDTYIVLGEAASTWSAADSVITGWLYRAMSEWDYGIRYLQFLGYDVTVIGLLFGTIANPTGSVIAATYQAETTAILSAIRTKYSANLPCIWVTVASRTNAASAAYNTGVLAADAADNDMIVFDSNINCLSAVIPYIRTKSVVNMGKLTESYIISKISGLNIPSVANVTITGILKNGEIISPSYVFTGTTEGDSNYIVVLANDVLGTAETFYGTYQKSETIIIQPGWVGKFIKIIVTPVQTTNPKNGLAVRNLNWEGAIVA